MTPVTKPISREYPARPGGRPLIVTLHPGGLIELREKRIGRSYAIGAHELFNRLIWEQKKGRA